MFPSLSFSPLLADFPSIQEIFFGEEQMGRGALGKNESFIGPFSTQLTGSTLQIAPSLYHLAVISGGDQSF